MQARAFLSYLPELAVLIASLQAANQACLDAQKQKERARRGGKGGDLTAPLGNMFGVFFWAENMYGYADRVGQDATGRDVLQWNSNPLVGG